jgi:DNA replication protein DnaC
MIYQQTIQQMKALRLKGMADFYQSQVDLPIQDQLSNHELIAQLIQAQWLYKTNQRAAYYLKLSQIKLNAVQENIEYLPQRNITKAQLNTLFDCNYILRAQPILITGPTGSGKSHLASALAHQACLLGYKSLYFNMHRFIEKISSSRLDGSYIKLINQLEKTSLIILDDFGLQPLDQSTKLTLLQLLEDRYNKKSTIISSQLPVANWHQYLNDPTLADAILDRLTGQAHRIELKGESFRKKQIL